MDTDTAAELIEQAKQDLAELEADIFPGAALLANYYRFKASVERAEAALKKERPE